MANPTVFNTRNEVTNNDRMLVALFVAIVIHIVILLGVRFTEPEIPVQSSHSIDVILVNKPSKKAPKAAKSLAAENQVGGGKIKSQKPEPAAKKLLSQGNNQRNHAQEIEHEEAEPIAHQKLITQKKSPKKIVSEKHPETTQDKESRPKLTAEMLQQQIAQYGNEIRLKQQSSDELKIKSVSSISAHKFLAAQYMKDWEQKVERTGNRNYPAFAAKKNFSGALTMDVGVKADGSIYSIRISRSSGYPALDEAAKRIVRMSAPFPALPSDLLKEVNILVITRKWKFSDESVMSTP